MGNGPLVETLLTRVQRDNQPQILSKLLHDLRNPVHSIRITVELFGRLARGGGDLEKLVGRAVSYIDPAQMALGNLMTNSERLGHYLSAPAAARIVAVDTQDLLSEITMLLRSSRRRLRVTCESCEGETSIVLSTDRMRLSHVLLHCCLSNTANAVTLAARPESEDRACIEVRYDASARAPDAQPHAQPLSYEELRALIESAGGSVLSADADKISLTFKRSREPAPAAG